MRNKRIKCAAKEKHSFSSKAKPIMKMQWMVMATVWAFFSFNNEKTKIETTKQSTREERTSSSLNKNERPNETIVRNPFLSFVCVHFLCSVPGATQFIHAKCSFENGFCIACAPEKQLQMQDFSNENKVNIKYYRQSVVTLQSFDSCSPHISLLHNNERML